MLKLLIFIFVYILSVIILTIIIPPGIEDKTYMCVVKPSGYCEYPRVWNISFVIGLVFITIIILIIAMVSLVINTDSSAYIMSTAEAWSKILPSERMNFKIPDLMFVEFLLVQPIEAGKKIRYWYKNPQDYNRVHILTLNMMSDYATTSIGIKQKSPLCSWTNKPLSMSSANMILSSRERDLLTKTIALEEELNRKNLISGPVADIYQESLEQKRERLKKQGEING